MIKKLINATLKFIYPIRGKYNEETYGPMTEYDRMLYWYLPCVAMTILPFSGLIYLFWGLTDPNKTLFSNDGPLGVMMSQYMQDGYAPGQPKWNDLYWIGMPEGVTPVGLTVTFHWLCRNPPLLLTVFVCFVIFFFYALRNWQPRDDGREIPPAPERPPQDRSTAVWIHRALFLVAGTAFYLGADWSGGTPTDPTTADRLFAFALLGYAMFGPISWLSVEMENLEHWDSRRVLGKRSP